jgi:hypothetical protein
MGVDLCGVEIPCPSRCEMLRMSAPPFGKWVAKL